MAFEFASPFRLCHCGHSMLLHDVYDADGTDPLCCVQGCDQRGCAAMTAADVRGCASADGAAPPGVQRLSEAAPAPSPVDAGEGVTPDHLWPCGCLKNNAGAHRGACPDGAAASSPAAAPRTPGRAARAIPVARPGTNPREN